MEMLDVSVKEANQECFEQGKCTWRYALVDGSKTDILDAPRGSHGICPSCGDELIARQGEMNTWHWAHKNGHVCDKWYEPKGAWHCWWQNQFDKAWQEVVIVRKGEGEEGQEIKHVADICTDEGWIIEFQYSSIQPEMIRAREAFYKNMVWVVCGTRYSSSAEKGLALFEEEFSVFEGGIFYAVLPDANAFSKHWRTSKKPIFFDFYGTFREPVGNVDLLCLLPEIKGIEGRVIARVPQIELITETQQNNLECFIDKFRHLLKGVKALQKQAKKDEELREAERQRKEKEKLEKYKEEEWKDELKNPIKFVISLGWIRAFVLFKKEGADKIIKDWAWDGAGEEGMVAIHFRNHYTQEDYNRELKWMAQEVRDLVGEKIPDYRTLKKFAGCIVGKCSYTRDVNGRFLLRWFELFQTYDQRVRLIPCVPDKQKIWSLEEPYFTMVNDRKFKFNTLPSCPKCGERLVHRTNSRDKSSFWGCSKFPNCTYIYPFGSFNLAGIDRDGARELNRFIKYWCRPKKRYYLDFY